MAQNLKSGDIVTIIAGDNKGKSGKIVKMDRKNNKAMIEGIGIRESYARHSVQPKRWQERHSYRHSSLQS